MLRITPLINIIQPEVVEEKKKKLSETVRLEKFDAWQGLLVHKVNKLLKTLAKFNTRIHYCNSIYMTENKNNHNRSSLTSCNITKQYLYIHYKNSILLIHSMKYSLHILGRKFGDL